MSESIEYIVNHMRESWIDGDGMRVEDCLSRNPQLSHNTNAKMCIRDRYEITCRGGAVTFVINGVKMNEGTNGNLTKGRIALQSEGTEIHFKDVVIKKLKADR